MIMRFNERGRKSPLDFSIMHKMLELSDEGVEELSHNFVRVFRINFHISPGKGLTMGKCSDQTMGNS